MLVEQVPWNAPEQSTHSAVRPKIAPSVGLETQTAAAVSNKPRRPTTASRAASADSRAALSDSRAALADSRAPPTNSSPPVDRPTPVSPVPARDAETPFSLQAQTSIAPATPAQRSYAQVVAQYIESPQIQDTVTPLARLYFATLDRHPDLEGLDWYIDQRAHGRTLESIADEFAGSSEFNMRYGAVSNEAFVDQVFENVFGVPPDAAQRAYWIDQLDSGVSRGRVMLAFSEGTDFRSLTANEVFVAIAYAETLRRMPDDAAFARWVAFLDAGNSRDAVIAGLLAQVVAREPQGKAPLAKQ